MGRLLPGGRFQKSILTGVLNTELVDVVAELVLIFVISVHHCREESHDAS